MAMKKMNLIVAGESSFPVLEMTDFQNQLKKHLSDNGRVVSFFGSPSHNGEIFLNVLVASASGKLHFLRSERERNGSYHSLTSEFPQLHCFERECFEQYGIKPSGHPWLRAIRYPYANNDRLEDYPFYKIEGKEVHEVGVGPIHAGVIEPGHFRFMCYGETVHHLEIQLGFQHRGVENLLLQRDPGHLAPLIETVSGDTSIAHTWAYCSAWEALCGVTVPWQIELVRGMALELERIAMHLAGLSGMCTDVAFLPGGSTYGRLRTTAINTSMRLCGSRFGRGWLRPGAVRFEWNEEIQKDLKQAILLLNTDLKFINELFLTSKTVQHRMKTTGKISKETALEMGFVGMVARSSGVALDLRTSDSCELYEKNPIGHALEHDGDCWSRALLRISEIEHSLKWLSSAVEMLNGQSLGKIPLGKPAPNSLAISLVEGWRGEVMHCLQTDAAGKLLHYKVQDPSLRNWFALALAVRTNDISDFPICNKSFDLSYCGHDL